MPRPKSRVRPIPTSFSLFKKNDIAVYPVLGRSSRDFSKLPEHVLEAEHVSFYQLFGTEFGKTAAFEVAAKAAMELSHSIFCVGSDEVVHLFTAASETELLDRFAVYHILMS